MRNRTDAEPAIKHKRLSKVDMRQKLIGNNLMLIGKIGVTLRLIKTASVGMCVLDLRKVLILPPYPGCRENNSPFVPVFPFIFYKRMISPSKFSDFRFQLIWHAHANCQGHT